MCLDTCRTPSGPLWVPSAGLGPVLSLCWSSRSCWGPRVGFSTEGSKLDEGLSAESSNRVSSWLDLKRKPEQALSVMSVSHQVVAVNVQFSAWLWGSFLPLCLLLLPDVAEFRDISGFQVWPKELYGISWLSPGLVGSEYRSSWVFGFLRNTVNTHHQKMYIIIMYQTSFDKSISLPLSTTPHWRRRWKVPFFAPVFLDFIHKMAQTFNIQANRSSVLHSFEVNSNLN